MHFALQALIFCSLLINFIEPSVARADIVHNIDDIQFSLKKHKKRFFGLDFTENNEQISTDNTELLPEIKIGESEYKVIRKIDPKISNAVTHGKGIWVNVWNYPKNIDFFFKKLDQNNIDVLYLQVNRSTTNIFRHPEQIDAIIETAHQYNIKVIGWSYAYLRNVREDAKKFIYPAKYITKHGHQFDGMAADIEENYGYHSVKKYTEILKAELPKNYPLIIILYSPRIRNNYPWKYLAQEWDIFMPMVYWHGIRRRNLQTVTNFVTDSIQSLRNLTGKHDLKIHLITDGEKTSPDEVATSIHVAKKLRVNAGISVYPEHLVSDSILRVIKNFELD